MNKKFLLQLGLAFVLIYAGLDSLIHPDDWVGFVPMWVENFGLTRILALHIHSVVEIVLGVWLLTGWKVKWAGLITAADLAALIIVNGFGRGTFLLTFRDVSIALTALYLFVAE